MTDTKELTARFTNWKIGALEAMDNTDDENAASYIGQADNLIIELQAALAAKLDIIASRNTEITEWKDNAEKWKESALSSNDALNDMKAEVERLREVIGIIKTWAHTAYHDFEDGITQDGDEFGTICNYANEALQTKETG